MKLRVNTNRYFTSIHQFCFVKQIGIGSFGVVKLALHLGTNRCYAIKIVFNAISQVDLNQSISQSQILLLERQINIHSKIDHPHIIKLWDTLIQENSVYMIMQLAENGTLFAYQNKHKILNEQQSFKYFSQILSAISYMHSLDFMHRDIKPQNILLDSSGNVKLCDLGWATDKINVKRKTFCGTYEYMAPQMVFQNQYDATIDIWALGILLYQLLHGYAPFSAKNLQQMRQKVKKGYYELSNNLGKQVKNLIVDILQFQGKLRPSFQTINKHPWMQKMKKIIINQLNSLQVSTNNKSITIKGKNLLQKKHKRFQSLANQSQTKKLTQNSIFNQLTPFQKIIDQNKKIMKKKCKTQGQQSIQKVFGQGKHAYQSRPKIKRQKQNIALSKTGLIFKGEINSSATKMKKIAQKLNQLTNKYPSQKKKKIKNIRDQFI